ncbi:uncharacterized protein FOMMEDRAFT_26867 [Fomitiporia mediterranea MF3/22]|uniref:uncharacterized protein n=1 Tax=Fomitiporia mediterranea (strain MF3/22) TaxID=694068 RepID=UPI0004408A6D|nr:uncharacterized protein FOMMEDRAFT_26867 [Fomitiporia mediterranea MF3/22]EJD06113.1 hypothetical protein FOMMEDRAFT_26867 [Fomitiporia mediterranea MF3/22]
MNTAAAERASHAPNLESLIEGKELNTTDRSGSEPPRSTRDNQHARKPPSKASVKTRWRDQLGRDRTEPGDKYRFAALLPILVNAWMSTSFQANPVVNEVSNRRGTDTMIELAFQLRRGADHIWRAEVDMVLPGTPDCVRADAVAALNLPEDWTDFLGELNNRYVFSWAWTVELIDLPESTVTFSYEAKVDDFKVVLRQVQLTMFSSQLHRRALGLEDGPVFGATFNKNILRFYVSNWENDTVVVRRILEYTMGEDVAASVDAVSSADTSDEMECDESHPNENVAVVDSNEELGNGLVDSMVSPLGHPDEFSAKTVLRASG